MYRKIKVREQILAGSETCLVRCAGGLRSRAGAGEGGLDYTASLIKIGFLYDQQNAALLLAVLGNVPLLSYISRASIVGSSILVRFPKVEYQSSFLWSLQAVNGRKKLV